MAWIDVGTDEPKWIDDSTPGLLPGEREGLVRFAGAVNSPGGDYSSQWGGIEGVIALGIPRALAEEYERAVTLSVLGDPVSAGRADSLAQEMRAHPSGAIQKMEAWSRQRHADKSVFWKFMDQYVTVIFAAAMGGAVAASGAGGGAAVAVESGALLTTVEASLPVVAPEVVAHSMFELFSGAPQMFSAEAAVAEASAVVYAPATAQLAQYAATPLMFSAEAAVAEAFGGAYLSPPAAPALTFPVAPLDLAKTAKAIMDAAKPLLAIGGAARSLMGAGPTAPPAPGAPGGARDTPRDTLESDALWTLGTLVVLGAMAFGLLKT